MTDEAVERVMALADRSAAAKQAAAANVAAPDAKWARLTGERDAARAALRAEVTRLAAIEAAARSYRSAHDHFYQADHGDSDDPGWAKDYRRMVNAESALDAALARREGTE